MNEKSACCEIEKQLYQEFRHVKSCWCCFFMLGVLLVLCGTAAIVVPPFTVAFSLITAMVLGVLLMVAGIVTIVSSFWVGKWSALLLHLLVGILYLVTGFIITERPGESAVLMTLFIAATFIVLGSFRIASACAAVRSMGLGFSQRHSHFAVRYSDFSPFWGMCAVGDWHSRGRGIAA